MVKYILWILLFVLGVSFALILLPLLIGGFVAYLKFTGGHILGGIIAVVLGLVCEVIWWLIMTGGEFVGSVGGYHDEECPYCGSGDTDGNHCHTCDGDF